MAELALRLRVFIASPGDVCVERNIAEQELLTLSQDAAADQLLIQPYRWENAGPFFERPQGPLSRALQQSELTIAIVWTRLGSAATYVEEKSSKPESGFEEEFRIAGDLVRSGRADDLLLYVRTSPPPAGTDPQQLQAVTAFIGGLERKKILLSSPYDNPETFQRQLRRDLHLWAKRWVGVPEICRYALEHSIPSDDDESGLGENVLNRLRGVFDERTLDGHLDVIGRAAVRVYQNGGPKQFAQPLDLPDQTMQVIRDLRRTSDVHPFIVEGPKFRFSHPEWFCLFCAHGLVDAITKSDVSAVARVPYVNNVHQLLWALRPSNEVVNRLRSWLLNTDGATTGEPIARNFAAYELGMLGIIEAQDDLAYALENDRGTGVPTYCITSLGKLRSRRHLPILVRLFASTADEQLRLLITQAVCRIVGVSDFEL